MFWKRWWNGWILIFYFTSAGLSATFNVNSTGDFVDSNPGNGVCATASGLCTLRAAVMESTSVGGADVINVPAGTYILTIPGAGENFGATGDLDLNEATINGNGTVIIDGGSVDRVFDIYNTSIIRGVIVQNGFAVENGGGIRCNYDCTLDEVTVRANQSQGWGGGIRNEGDLVIYKSTISGNSCIVHGGGISNYGGDIIAQNSTISRNMANFDSGGIDNDNAGFAGLYSVTVAQNIADNENDGFGNAGGISVFSGTVYLQNTMLANNEDNGGEAPDCAFSISSGGHNLIGNITSCIVADDETGNIYNTNPLLGPLGNNGGPTSTHALQFGSPAIDAGLDSECPFIDQRGVSRPHGPHCDIGSYEYDDITFLYADNFEDGDASDWAPNKGNWTVIAGDLTGTHNRKASNIAPFSGCGVGCSVGGYVRIDTPGGRASLLAFYQDKRNLVEVIFMDDKDRIVLKQRQSGQLIAKGKFVMPIAVGVNYPVELKHLSGSLQVIIDGSVIID
ncbi:MAG TPA: choice-of-anchor Q domain-containing protein, partial [Acidobacteriota bacterium]|nr:choice-of-anchor Q domain-containing protein [Acidobacteriota bacterium]